MIRNEFGLSAEKRLKAQNIHRTACAACGFDFNEFYGKEFAKSFIEIHDVRSKTEQTGKPIDPETDLVPLCSNCHRMAHRATWKILTVSEIRELIQKQRDRK